MNRIFGTALIVSLDVELLMNDASHCMCFLLSRGTFVTWFYIHASTPPMHLRYSTQSHLTPSHLRPLIFVPIVLDPLRLLATSSEFPAGARSVVPANSGAEREPTGSSSAR